MIAECHHDLLEAVRGQLAGEQREHVRDIGRARARGRDRQPDVVVAALRRVGIETNATVMIDLRDQSRFAGATPPDWPTEIAPETATPPGAQTGRGQIHRKESGSAADITPAAPISAPTGPDYPR